MAEKYLLELYVAGETQLSAKMIVDLQQLLKEHFADRYCLKIINVLENPEVSEEKGVFVTPTLLRSLPLPIRKIIGDLQDVEQVLREVNVVQQ